MPGEWTYPAFRSGRHTIKEVGETDGLSKMTEGARAVEVVEEDEIRMRSRCRRLLRNL